MATINLASKYSTKLDERFSLSSRTDAYTGNDYDFTGVNTINIYTIDKTSLVDYNRSGTTDRFGTTSEVGDIVQTKVLSKDKGFSRSIDYGNAGQQYNVKRAQTVLQNVWDETIVPTLDKYRITNWIAGAGHTAVATLDKTSIISAIMDADATLTNALVPADGRVLFVKASIYSKCKLSTEVVALQVPGDNSIVNGKVPTLDGMPLVVVPDSYFPTGVNFMIKLKGSTIDPVTLKTLRVQKAPKGYDADVLEGRVIYDSFVLDQKAEGIYVHGLAANVLADPVITNASNSCTFTQATATGVKYTLDGSNPKTNSSATTVLAAAFSTPVVLTAGQTLKAYAYNASYISSGLAVATYA